MNRSLPRKIVEMLAVGAAAAWTVVAWAGNNRNTPYHPVINPADFVSVIDNQYFPLAPGTTYVYQAQTKEGLEEDRVSVTTDTLEIMEVTCTVVRDTATLDGVIQEDTFDYYAQDKDGNVWYFGEFTTAFQEGQPPSHAGSWTAGVDGALPGIIMQAKPRPGKAYRQEYLPGVAEDWAKALRLNARVTLAEFGTLKNCLMTKEWTPLEPGHIEQKFYAKGIGLVLTLEHHGKVVRTELVAIEHP